ncbi:SGNH hydrolase domain-containing protein [Roseovarius sp. Pro17]|uniref:SGNH hydrolase domain-containing protein n=1 Tax=Roseovarius sp. Pro17 TaxID=3108175 RepID=UPI002D7995AE|nr:SGNH hydrolase domain-containing protein [Roseovarius sp. Pro17]
MQSITKAIHPKECFETGQTNILLSGDSHGASLYLGLANLMGDGMALTQLTASGCPLMLMLMPMPMPMPMLESLTHRRNCNEVNAHVFDHIAKVGYDRIILDAGWRHGHYPISLDETVAKLLSTQAMRSLSPISVV